MPHFMVAASGPDQPGIVAAFTRVFVDLDCNLEDSSMTVLRGHFAMMLVVEAPDGMRAGDLESDLAFATSALGLIVNAWEISDLVAPSVGGERWTLRINGADRKGIVHAFADTLAGRDANIVDVVTRLEAPSEYSMQLSVIVPDAADAPALGRDLQATAERIGVRCSFER